jgi:hypothetical protein
MGNNYKKFIPNFIPETGMRRGYCRNECEVNINNLEILFLVDRLSEGPCSM